MDIIFPVLTGLSLSAITGFRAFLPPLMLGLMLRFFPSMVELNDNFIFLTQTPALIALGIAAIAEFLGDKIPVVDNFLAWLELPAKIAFSAILTFALVPAEASNWFFLLITMVFAESATLVVHTGKTGLRALSTAGTGGIANPVIGIIEDIISFVGSLIALIAPWLAVILILLIFYKCVRFLFGKKGGNDGRIGNTKPSFIWYYWAQTISYIFFKVFNGLKIYNRELIPKGRQFVTVANHASLLDGFIMAAAVRLPLFIMVKKESFENPMKGFLLRKALSFPIDRSKVDTAAIKYAIKLLNDGQCLGLFPEGTRNREGKVGSFKLGAIKFALKKKLPILPAYISNAHNLTPPGCIFPRPAKMTVHFLDPIDTKAELEAGKDENQILQMLYDRICEKGQEVMGYDVSDNGVKSIEKHSANHSSSSLLHE